jgi:DNA-binding transcriptional LysR family regulator
MSKSVYFGIDGRTLKIFLAVLEEGAVTKAAERIGVTQSAVSHTSKLNEPTVEVANFNAVTEFIKGTDLIATQPAVMERGCLRDLAWAPLPVETESLCLYLMWHERYDDDPGHQWMKQRIADTVESIVAA